VRREDEAFYNAQRVAQMSRRHMKESKTKRDFKGVSSVGKLSISPV